MLGRKQQQARMHREGKTSQDSRLRLRWESAPSGAELALGKVLFLGGSIFFLVGVIEAVNCWTVDWTELI